MMTSNLIVQCQNLIDALPLPLITLKGVPEKRGALLHAGKISNIEEMFAEWIDKAFWMLENSAVVARNLPTGKFVALAYKDGFVVVSDELKGSLSEEIQRACTVATYSEFNLHREDTCLIFTHTPFELSIVEDADGQCMVFLIGNAKADVVVHSAERLKQIVVN